MERGEFFTCALKKGGISGIHTFFLFLSQTGTLSSLIPPFDRFHFDKSINPFLRDYSEMIKKKKSYEFSFKAWLKTVRSIPARKNWQEKGEYGKLFTRISGQNTSGVGREGKFALESCGYEPCATAYHRTLSTPPVESTVTRCTT